PAPAGNKGQDSGQSAHYSAGDSARWTLRVFSSAQRIRRSLGGATDHAFFSSLRDELMHADFSVELGRDDPVLEIPWISDDPAVRYFDLKKCPELVLQIPEAVAHPDMGAFLSRINTQGFPLATAKCDAWDSREI